MSPSHEGVESLQMNPELTSIWMLLGITNAIWLSSDHFRASTFTGFDHTTKVFRDADILVGATKPTVMQCVPIWWLQATLLQNVICGCFLTYPRSYSHDSSLIFDWLWIQHIWIFLGPRASVQEAPRWLDGPPTIRAGNNRSVVCFDDWRALFFDRNPFVDSFH